MNKTVNIDEMHEWIRIMANPEIIGAEQAFWRLTGALSILARLDLISFEEKDRIEDKYIAEYIT